MTGLNKLLGEVSLEDRVKEIIYELDTWNYFYLERDRSFENHFQERVYHIFEHGQKENHQGPKKYVGAIVIRRLTAFNSLKSLSSTIYITPGIGSGQTLSFDELLEKCSPAMQTKLLFNIDLFR